MSRIRSRIVFLSTVCALCAGAADIYTVTTTIPSGGIDLTALGDGYRQDAIAGQAAGANLPIAVTGRVVHASGLTPENPFIVSNTVASSYFILKDADLVGKVPIRVAGTGTTYFPGTTLTNDGVAANGLFSARADSQIDELVVAGKTTPGMMYMTNKAFYVRNDTYIGRDGGSGKIYSTAPCLGRRNSGGTTDKDLPWLGQRSSANLYLGSSSAKGKGFASGTLHLMGNSSASAWSLYFGSANNDLPPTTDRNTMPANSYWTAPAAFSFSSTAMSTVRRTPSSASGAGGSQAMAGGRISRSIRIPPRTSSARARTAMSSTST